MQQAMQFSKFLARHTAPLAAPELYIFCLVKIKHLCLNVRLFYINFACMNTCMITYVYICSCCVVALLSGHDTSRNITGDKHCCLHELSPRHTSTFDIQQCMMSYCSITDCLF